MLLRIIRDDAAYADDFARIFRIAAATIHIGMITEALAAFEHTLLARGSAFDRFYYGKDGSAISAEAITAQWRTYRAVHA